MDSNCLPYYHGDPIEFFRMKLPNAKKIYLASNPTTHMCLEDGRKRGITNSHAVKNEPTWVNPRSGLSVFFTRGNYKCGKALIDQVRNVLPADAIIDYPHYTKLDLLRKLKTSDLDNAHFRIFGKRGKAITRLNELPHAQPKRLTFSTVSDRRECGIEHGGVLNRLLIYGSSGRPMEDWRCRPMPNEIYNLGKYLWERNYGYLTELSQVCPPNLCQVNFYYSRLKGHIRKHRDNGIRDSMGDIHYMSTPNSENSQLHGTNVMTFSLGHPMEFTLHAFRDDNSGRNNAKMYTDNDGLTLNLEDSSCFILHPKDDETHMHSAKFVGDNYFGVRVALNYRWCVNEKWFYTDQHPVKTLRWACANHVEMKADQIQWKFLLQGNERNYSKKEWIDIMLRNNCSNQYYFKS